MLQDPGGREVDSDKTAKKRPDADVSPSFFLRLYFIKNNSQMLPFLSSCWSREWWWVRHWFLVMLMPPFYLVTFHGHGHGQKKRTKKDRWDGEPFKEWRESKWRGRRTFFFPIRFALAHAPYVTLGKAHVRNNKNKKNFFFLNKLNWFPKLFSFLASQGPLLELA